jgi:hypothetical protein
MNTTANATTLRPALPRAAAALVAALVGLSGFAASADASSVTSFQRRHTIPGVAQSANDLLQTADGGYVYIGTRMPSAGVRQVSLTRTNADGQPLWCRIYAAGPGSTEGLSIAPAPDGGFVLGCRTDGAPIASNRMLLIRTDFAGNALAARAYDGLDIGRVRFAPAANAFVVVGNKISAGGTGGGGGPGVFLKTDLNLNQVAGVAYFQPADPTSQTSSLILSDVAEDATGSFFISGRQSFGGTSSRLLAMRTRVPSSPFGAVLWSNDYFAGLPGLYSGMSVRRDRTGEAVFVGTASVSSNPTGNAAACRVDGAGNRLWANLYSGGVNPSGGLELMPNGNYVFTTSVSPQDCGLVQINGVSGAVTWSRRFGNAFDNDSMRRVVSTTDGGFASVGFKYPGTASQSMIYKHDGQGWTGCNEANYAIGSSPSTQTAPIALGVTTIGPDCAVALQITELAVGDEAFCYRVKCLGDYNDDVVVDFFDYLDFVADFDRESPKADFNYDLVVDFFDYLDFVVAFIEPC